MTAETQQVTKPTLADQLAYILDNTQPESQWREAVEYTVEATYELLREERGDFYDPTVRGVAERQGACFGSKRSAVQVRPPRFR